MPTDILNKHTTRFTVEDEETATTTIVTVETSDDTIMAPTYIYYDRNALTVPQARTLWSLLGRALEIADKHEKEHSAEGKR